MDIRQRARIISVALVALWLLAFATPVLGTPPPLTLGHDTLSPTPLAAATAQTAGARFDLTWDTGCLTPPSEAVTALTYATELWSGWISSTVPIEVLVCWTANLPVSGDALGAGAPATYQRNFDGAPLVDVYYPTPLADALHGTDLAPGQSDIKIWLKSDISWSYGITPAGANVDYDLVSVTLHELGHGLGFIGNMSESYNIGFCGTGALGYLDRCPTPYDWFAVDSTNVPLLDYLTPDPRQLGARLKSDAAFGGPNTVVANGGTAARLYTPSFFYPGVSLSHLDNAVYAEGENRLMTPYGTMVRHPGSVTLGIMQDMGWVRADGAAGVTTAGPLTAAVGEDVTLTGNFIWPSYAGQTLTYTWTADNNTPIAHTHASAADEITLRFDTAGVKTIVLVAAAPDGAASAGAVRTVRIADLVLAVTGPANGSTGQSYAFDAAVAPADTSLPITYTWQATGQSTVVHPNIYGVDSQSYTWTTGGMKTLTVTAAVNGASVTSVHQIDIDEPELDHFIFLPLTVKS